MNFPRRQFLGSSLVVLGSTLLDALSTPLWRWNRSLTVRVGADASSALEPSSTVVGRETGHLIGAVPTQHKIDYLVRSYL